MMIQYLLSNLQCSSSQVHLSRMVYVPSPNDGGGEVREGSARTGFMITDLSSGQEGWLAKKDLTAGPRVGSYVVVSEDLEKIGVAALERSMKGPADLVIVDEIGPMEMTSPSFRNNISMVLNGNRTVSLQ